MFGRCVIHLNKLKCTNLQPSPGVSRSQTTRASLGTQAGNRQKKAEALTEVKQEPGAPPGLWRLLQVQTRAHRDDADIALLSSEIISLAASVRAYETAKQVRPPRYSWN